MRQLFLSQLNSALQNTTTSICCFTTADDAIEVSFEFFYMSRNNTGLIYEKHMWLEGLI